MRGRPASGQRDERSTSVQSTEERPKGGYSRRLGPFDGRLELEARLAVYQPDLGNSFRFNDNDRAAELMVGWASRCEWGTVRIGAGYVRGF